MSSNNSIRHHAWNKWKVLLHTRWAGELTVTRYCGSQKCKLGKSDQRNPQNKTLSTEHKDVYLWLRQYLTCKLLEALNGHKGKDHLMCILLLYYSFLTFTEISTRSRREGEGKKNPNQLALAFVSVSNEGSVSLGDWSHCQRSAPELCPQQQLWQTELVSPSREQLSTWLTAGCQRFFLLWISLSTPTFWSHEDCLQLKLIQQLKDQNIYVCLET